MNSTLMYGSLPFLAGGPNRINSSATRSVFQWTRPRAIAISAALRG